MGRQLSHVLCCLTFQVSLRAMLAWHGSSMSDLMAYTQKHKRHEILLPGEVEDTHDAMGASRAVLTQVMLRRSSCT